MSLPVAPREDAKPAKSPGSGSRLGRFLGLLRGRYLIVLTLGYIAIATAIMVVRSDWPTPDQFLILGLLFALLLGKPIMFLKDWSPLIVVFLAYEYLRGVVPALGWSVHVAPLIRADYLLPGPLPTLALQNLLYNPAHPEWYDYVFTLVYLIHFVLPLSFGLLLWVKDRSQFRRFMVAISILSIAGFLTYMFYPAMPPWMAAAKGLIPPVRDIMGRTIHLFAGGPGFLPTLYTFMAPNQVAAMPSLHAAYPTLVYLFAVRYFGKKGHIFLLYALTVWIGIVYMAQHWVIDIVVGVLYAFLAFYFVEVFSRRFGRKTAPEGGEVAAPAGAITPTRPGQGPLGDKWFVPRVDLEPIPVRVPVQQPLPPPPARRHPVEEPGAGEVRGVRERTEAGGDEQERMLRPPGSQTFETP